MPAGKSRSSKQRPAEVAAEAKKHFIPIIKNDPKWTTYSYLYHEPLSQLGFTDLPLTLDPPEFCVQYGDPVDTALQWSTQCGSPVPIICAANDKRPGGDWETGVCGFEERLCRRSSLAATLATPGPGSHVDENYPIPVYGAIWSQDVVVFRGPHDAYDKRPMEEWQPIPVCSVSPMRWPKLTQNGTKYSFAKEREMVKAKLSGALRVCAYNNCTTVVIGDFGLGNAHRNPPQELAELWREVFLYDPELRGRIRYAAFVFEDTNQSTAQLILDDIEKKNKTGGGGGASGKARSKTSSSYSGGSTSTRSSGISTDFEIFQRVFDSQEVRRVMGQRDSRYGLDNLLTE